MLFFLLSILNILVSPKKPSFDQILGSSAEIDLGPKINFWTDFLSKHPNYVDGWLELAKLEYAKGDFRESKKAITKAYEVNPNSEKIRSLEKLLGF